MSNASTPFEQAREVLGQVSITDPNSTISQSYNERGVFSKTLSDGTLVHISLAGEGGAQGGSGQIVGRVHIGEGNDWHLYELHDDERVWEFAKTETADGQPVTTDRWLDDQAKQTLHDRLLDIQVQLQEL